jgi:gluconolactonase
MELFETLDKRFAQYVIPIVLLEKLHTGLRWDEGPVYFADQHCLLFSDVPNNRMLRFDEQTSQVTVFRADSNFSNGNTRDRHGRLITCEHRGRRVTRTEYDGTITIIADRYEGKRLNSPNDVVVKSDGTVWFTDPSYGISATYEGGKAEKRDRKLQRVLL